MEYTLNQNHALRIITNIFFRLSNLWEKTELLKKECLTERHFPFCKARRQGRELANEIDKYVTLACKIAAKYFEGVDVDIYDDLSDWMKYDKAVKSYFQN